MDWRELTLVAEALAFATKAHEGQKRKGEAGIPYITHPIAVADILWKAGVRSPIVLAAALLHDTVEDCGVTYGQLVAVFGPKVADTVMEVTDTPGLKGKERKDAQVAKAPRMSEGAKLVKLADKTANLTDIMDHPPGWPPKVMRGYALSAERVALAIGSGVNPVLYGAFAGALARVIVATEDA